MNFTAYSPQIVIGACIVVLVVILIIAWGVKRQRDRRRTAGLRRRFGTEYDYALSHNRSRRHAEAELANRLRRVEGYRVHALSPTERSRFMADWDAIQTRFVDHPRGAVTEAEEMVNDILQARGYVAGNTEKRAADLSVNHPGMVDTYRRANAINVRAAKNEASTEDLRTALILYRALFEELVGTTAISAPRAEAA
ncbi:MAG TPA: hypothetical protein VKB38_22105 [Terracidiphilus sp.]|nr:hypothetical protein [Terracidiphilus sp.]